MRRLAMTRISCLLFTVGREEYLYLSPPVDSEPPGRKQLRQQLLVYSLQQLL